MKSLLVALVFAGILTALVMAGVYMLRSGTERAKRGGMARALAVRVALSVLLFVCLLVAYGLGWIEPTGIPVSR